MVSKVCFSTFLLSETDDSLVRNQIVFAIITHDNDIKQQYIAVVNKRERQLPVAVLSFESCTLDAMKRSHTFQQQVTKLLYDAKVKAEVARHARSKERIIQLLLQQEYLAGLFSWFV